MLPIVSKTLKHVFCAVTPTGTTFIFKDGKVATFQPAAGRSEAYIDNPQHITWLQEEIAAGHPDFFVDPLKVTFDPLVDPLDAVKRKAVEDYLAEQAKLKDPTREMGGTDKTAPLTGVATTRVVGEGASNSNSGAPANVEAGAAGKVNAAPKVTVNLAAPATPTSL